MEERTHHPLSFSKWPAFSVCGWYESDDRESKASKSGTAKHLDFEECINEVNTGIPALHESAGARWAADHLKLIADGCEIHSETKVEIDAVDKPAHGVSGYCDAWFVKDGILTVVDFKSGAHSSVDYMPQVMGYAYALYLSLMKEMDIKNEIHCMIMYGASHEICAGIYKYEELLENARRCMLHVESKDNHEPCANGMCQYCKHNKECKAMAGNIIAFQKNELASMSNAALYDWCVSAKSAIEKWMADLKDIAIANGGVIDDGNIRYEIKTDKHGRMTSVDVSQLWWDMSEVGCSVSQEQIMKFCTISKKAFTDLYKKDAKEHGMLVKDVEAKYASRCVYGEPASKLVKVEKK